MAKRFKKAGVAADVRRRISQVPRCPPPDVGGYGDEPGRRPALRWVLGVSWFKELLRAFVLEQGFERVMQPGFHRAERDLDGFCDFRQRKAVHET